MIVLKCYESYHKIIDIFKKRESGGDRRAKIVLSRAGSIKVMVDPKGADVSDRRMNLIRGNKISVKNIYLS